MLAQQLQAETLQQFNARLRGQLLEPDDPEYDSARRVYNGMIDKHPALIARCCDVADVMTAVNFARNQRMLLAVRGGGHNGGGLGTCDDGLVIDLAHMRGIRVDPAACTVRVEGGCTWGDVDHATHAFGLATPSGIISSTGVGGLTLGGGIGHLTRQYGLTIDNLLEVDMVLADGSFVTANARIQNADLFWVGPGRWRQLWRRDVVSVPAASCPHGLRRSDSLAHGPSGRSHALLSRLHRGGETMSSMAGLPS